MIWLFTSGMQTRVCFSISTQDIQHLSHQSHGLVTVEEWSLPVKTEVSRFGKQSNSILNWQKLSIYLTSGSDRGFSEREDSIAVNMRASVLRLSRPELSGSCP